jgi:hypothetical protein
MEQLASFAELWLWLLASLEHNIKSIKIIVWAPG